MAICVEATITFVQRIRRGRGWQTITDTTTVRMEFPNWTKPADAVDELISMARDQLDPEQDTAPGGLRGDPEEWEVLEQKYFSWEC